MNNTLISKSSNCEVRAFRDGDYIIVCERGASSETSASWRVRRRKWYEDRMSLRPEELQKILPLLAITLLLAAVTCAAKDRQYETGTLDLIVAPAATYTDTTSCYRGAAGEWHCGGGISQDIAAAYFLTLADGQRISLTRAPWRHAVLHHFDLAGGPVPVRYRVVHHPGQTFYVIADPSGNEGTYYTTDKGTK